MSAPFGEGAELGFKLGVGGKVGPVRMGISTRGIGGGIGPLSGGTSWRGGRRSSSSSPSAFATLLGIIILVGIGWVIVAWPWMVGTYIATRHGVTPHSSTWNMAGWIPEIIYLALLVVVPLIVLITSRGRQMRAPGWRHAESDPPALQRWWDGSQWTAATQWNLADPYRSPERTPYVRRSFNEPVLSGGTYTHGACTIRHRRLDTAERCRQG